MENIGTINKNLGEAISQINRLKVFLKLVQKSGLEDMLSGPEPITLFAPTDQAFANLPEDTIEFWTANENREKLIAILKSHILDGNLEAHELCKMHEIKTISGHTLAINREYGKLMVTDNASVIQADIKCSNGVIHLIDAVIIPQI